jgi:hypothetical protein
VPRECARCIWPQAAAACSRDEEHVQTANVGRVTEPRLQVADCLTIYFNDEGVDLRTRESEEDLLACVGSVARLAR